MTRWLVCLYALALGTLAAQPNPSDLFPQQAEVFVDSAGLSRLELPNEVLTQVSAELSDLRLFDAQGNEVPYSIDTGRTLEAYTNSFQPQVTALNRSTDEPVRGEATYRETYRLELPESVSLAGQWTLFANPNSPEFVRRINVDAIAASGERTALLQDASYFCVQNCLVSKSRFQLPRFPSRVIEVVIEGQGGAYLEPSFTLDVSPAAGPRSAQETQLTIVQRTEERGRTVLEMERPRALIPTALRFQTSTRSFVRKVSATDAAREAWAPRRSVIFHVPAAVPMEQLEIPVPPALSNRFTVSIENGDSPPLQDLTVTAMVLPPALLFSMAPSAGEIAAGTLRFGGGSTKTPNYDVASLEAIMQAESSRGVPLEAPGQARLGPISANPDYEPQTLLSFASRPGAEVDARAYSHVRPVQLAPSPEGLTRIELSVQDAAVCRPDFADVRLTGADSAQWPYLLDRDARQDWLPLEVASGESENGSTTYRLTLPACVALIDRIRVDFPDAYFDRTYQLMAKIDGQDQFLFSDRLSSSEGDDVPIEIAFAPVRATELTLTIFDGNDQPLPAPAVEGRFPLPDLYTVAPAGDYKLLLGFPDDRPPVYELAQASSTVLAARAGAATLGEVVENPLFSASSRLRTGPGSQRALFWVALLAAVGVLAVMTLKTVRGEAGDAS